MGCSNSHEQTRGLNEGGFSEELSSHSSKSEDNVLEQESDEKVTFRMLQRNDYSRGYPSVLSGLTKGCEYDQKKFLQRYDEIFPSMSDAYKIVVLIDN